MDAHFIQMVDKILLATEQMVHVAMDQLDGVLKEYLLLEIQLVDRLCEGLLLL